MALFIDFCQWHITNESDLDGCGGRTLLSSRIRKNLLKIDPCVSRRAESCDISHQYFDYKTRLT